MNEVKYSQGSLGLVEEYKKIKNKKTVSWSDDKYLSIRKEIKDHYLKEQDYTCFFCRQRIVVKSNRSWDAEHIVSKATHPSFMFEPKNLCITCPDCNNEKRAKQVMDRENRVRFPMRSGAYKIVHPHFDIYDDHLKVIVEGQLYKFQTVKGRHTYQVYGLDRFMMDTGRTSGTNLNDKVQRLMQSALSDTNNYEKYEQELLEELLLKNSSKIGCEVTIGAIKRLRRLSL